MTKKSSIIASIIIWILIIGVTVAGCFLLLEPQWSEYQANEAEYAQLELEKDALDVSAIEENYEELEALRDDLDDYVEDEDLDYTMTALARTYDLEVEGIEIGHDVSAYVTSDLEEITAKSIVLSVYGDEADLLAFEEDIYERTDVFITSLIFSVDASTAEQYQSTYDVEVDGGMQIGFVLYMRAAETVTDEVEE